MKGRIGTLEERRDKVREIAIGAKVQRAPSSTSPRHLHKIIIENIKENEKVEKEIPRRLGSGEN